jgi:flagellar hook-basal body complex protein FliE
MKAYGITDWLKAGEGAEDRRVERGKDEGFSKVLKDSIEQVNRMQVEADRMVAQLLVGDGKNIHETMIALEKADISFRLMMRVRDKLLEAYNEVMRMQI